MLSGSFLSQRGGKNESLHRRQIQTIHTFKTKIDDHGASTDPTQKKECNKEINREVSIRIPKHTQQNTRVTRNPAPTLTQTQTKKFIIFAQVGPKCINNNNKNRYTKMNEYSNKRPLSDEV